jgi:hypothetical protein
MAAIRNRDTGLGVSQAPREIAPNVIPIASRRCGRRFGTTRWPPSFAKEYLDV